MSSDTPQADQPVLGIRREAGIRWERRVPLAPQQVAKLVKKGVKVIIQPSTIRCFRDFRYTKAGAHVQEDLSEASVIIGVKEVPINELIDNKTHMFFSHTIKAQPYNMKMLDAILAKNVRLIDYERIVNANNVRMVRFGKWAGFSGMIDLLRALGNRILGLGFSTPFLHVGYSHMYPSLESARTAVKLMGYEITQTGFQPQISPMIFVFTGGQGACSKGSVEIFELLPHEWVSVDELPTIARQAKSRDREQRVIYACLVSSEDYIVPNDPTKKFDKKEFYANPEQYHSVFHEKIAPYASVIINNVFWKQGMPRLLTKKHLRDLQAADNLRLMALGDIACDVGGGMEFMQKVTTIDSPTFVYDIGTGAIVDNNMEAPGVLVLSVDNLPTEFPVEASKYFGDSLLPFLEDVVRAKTTEAMPLSVQKAVIAEQGKLTPNYEYIFSLREQYEDSLNAILLLGAGLMTPALVSRLLNNEQNRITVASLVLEDAKKVARGQPFVTPVQLDITKDHELLNKLISNSDIVISMMPATLHVKAAEFCVKHKVSMVTASYISPAMRELDAAAKEAGIIMLNEIGLDPGIDHMSAMHEINLVKKKGGKIRRFRSVCGGLPSPEFANNPLGYKFSWNPRGVLKAGLNPALYRNNNKEVAVKGEELFMHAERELVRPCFNVEILPNRDSLSYGKLYGIDDAEEIFRGTIRFIGYSDVMWAFNRVGLFSDTTLPSLAPDAPKIYWPQLLAELLGNGTKPETVRSAVLARLFCDETKEFITQHSDRGQHVANAFKWFGFFDLEQEAARVGSPIDCLCAHLQFKLELLQTERDMVLLEHTFFVEWADKTTEEIKCTLIQYGSVGETAMARTVGVPVAIAAQLILDGAIKTTGVVAPIDEEVYEPLLARLTDMGISFTRTTNNT